MCRFESANRLRPFVSRIGLLLTIMICPTISWGQDVIAKPKPAKFNKRADDIFGARPMPRGPVHEAFAKTLQLTPIPAPIAPKVPPAAVEEKPNANKPSGANVEWIDGYWVYDDQAEKFLWVSGLWRRVPPGRKWEPTRWQKVEDGYTRISGSWIEAMQPVAGDALARVEKLPKTLEQGPTTPKPQNDAIWVPGNWEKPQTLDPERVAQVKEPVKQGDYTWAPGMWTQGQQDWVWVPDHYVHDQDGARRVSGYWDYPWSTRGKLNACCAEPAANYTPVPLAANDQFGSLWTDARTGLYYYGDFASRGYDYLVPWHQYHAQNVGYDPLCCYYDNLMGPRYGGDFVGYLDSRYAVYGYRPRPIARLLAPAAVVGGAAAVLSSGGGRSAAAVASNVGNAASAAASSASNVASGASGTAAANAVAGNPAAAGAANTAASNAAANPAGGNATSNPASAAEPASNTAANNTAANNAAANPAQRADQVSDSPAKATEPGAGENATNQQADGGGESPQKDAGDANSAGDQAANDKPAGEKDAGAGEGADKEGADKEGADKEGADKEGADKEGADKEGADKEGADKEGADKEGADKEGSDKEGADKEGDDKEGADKEGADDKGGSDAGGGDGADSGGADGGGEAGGK